MGIIAKMKEERNAEIVAYYLNGVTKEGKTSAKVIDEICKKYRITMSHAYLILRKNS